MKQKCFGHQVLFIAFLIASVITGAFWGRTQKAYGIPAYARVLGVNCEQCHTIWPRLNAFGRKFKVKGYVDQSDNPGLPLAGRVLVNASSVNTTPAGGPTTTSGVINFPSQVNLFIGTRITPQIGVFSAFTVTPTNNGAGSYIYGNRKIRTSFG